MEIWLTYWLQEHIIHGLNWPEYDADGNGIQKIAVLRGGKGVRSPPDGLRSSPGKVSYTDLHKTPG